MSHPTRYLLFLSGPRASSSGSPRFVLLRLLFSLSMTALGVLPLQRTSEAQSFNSLYSFSDDAHSPYAGVIQASDGSLYGTTSAGPTGFGYGNVFKITTGGTLTTLHTFRNSSTDGASPMAGLIQGKDGWLYGTTTRGGTHGSGTVFRITTGGQFTILYSFTGGSDGNYPMAGLIQASDGSFYGTTEYGGANGTGAIFKITTGGAFTSLYSFSSVSYGINSDGANPATNLIQATDGNLYGTTAGGGTYGLGTVFRIMTGGTLTTLYIFSGYPTDGAYPSGLIQAKDSHLYGTTAGGGAHPGPSGSGAGTVFRITAAGALTTCYSFIGPDGASPGAGVIQGNDGNLYGTTWQGGANGYGTIFGITTGGALATLYSFSTTAGNGANADGAYPYAGVIQANDGSLYGTTLYGGAQGDGTVFSLQLVPPFAYAITELGTLGRNNTYAYAINNKGEITGEVDEYPNYPAMATYWDSSGAANGIGFLSGGSYSFGYGISANGRIVGGADDGSKEVAFSGGTIGALFDMGGVRASIAYGMNDTWGVVGGADFNGLWSAFVHGSGSSQIVTDDNLGGGPYSNAYGINNNGQIIGVATRPPNFYEHALLWNPIANAWNWTDIGTLGGDNSVGYGINDTGQAVGASDLTGDTATDAFLWTPGGVSGTETNPQMQDLGALGSQGSSAQAINFFGRVVGYSYDDVSGQYHAFIWDSVNLMQDLNNFIDPASGWVLQVATGINDTGQIVGYGTYGGYNRGFLLNPRPVVDNLSVNPAVFMGSASVTGTVTLSLPAPAGGVIAYLASDTPAVASVPVSVTVPEGQTRVAFTITTNAPTADTNVTITATHFGETPQTALLTVQAMRNVASLTLNPTSVLGGSSSTATLVLDTPAPSGGVDVALSSDNNNAQVPASVNVAQGSTTATFTVTTSVTQTTQSANITATLNGTATAALTIGVPVPTGVALNPTSVLGGVSSTGTVTLNAPAPSGGYIVSLSSSSGSATVPATVTVAGGATSATFTVATQPVASNTSTIITATAGGACATATLNVTAMALALNPSTVIGGKSSTGKVTLSGPASPGGAVVTLSSSNVAAKVPASVTVAAAATTASFTVKTTSVTAVTTATITGTRNGVSQIAALTITPAQLVGLAFSPTSLKGGGTTKLIISLSGAAPSGGAAITLVSDNSKVVPVPTSTTIPAGASSITLNIKTGKVTSSTTVTVTGAWSGTNKSASVTVN